MGFFVFTILVCWGTKREPRIPLADPKMEEVQQDEEQTQVINKKSKK